MNVNCASLHNIGCPLQQNNAPLHYPIHYLSLTMKLQENVFEREQGRTIHKTIKSL